MSSSPFYLRAVLQPTLAVVNATATAADSGGEGNSTPAVDPTGNVLTGDTDMIGTIEVQVWLTAGSDAESVDIGLSYDASAASYVSATGPAGWQTLGNNVSPGTVLVSGYDPSVSSPNPIATTSDSLFATVSFTPTGGSNSLEVALTSGDYSDVNNNFYTPSLPAASTFSLAGGMTVTAVATGTGSSETSGTVGSALAGMYGSLTLNADGSYTYSVNTSDPAVAALATGQSVADVFTYTVTDVAQQTRTATLTVTVDGMNHPPVASSIPDASATIGSLFTDTISAFSDPDYAASQISYSVTLAGGGALPTWLTFDPSTLTFSGTPPTGSAGSLTLDVTGTDPRGLSGEATFNLSVSAMPCFHAGTRISTPGGSGRGRDVTGRRLG